jgi:hypothetical protein
MDSLQPGVILQFTKSPRSWAIMKLLATTSQAANCGAISYVGMGNPSEADQCGTGAGWEMEVMTRRVNSMLENCTAY